MPKVKANATAWYFGVWFLGALLWSLLVWTGYYLVDGYWPGHEGFSVLGVFVMIFGCVALGCICYSLAEPQIYVEFAFWEPEAGREPYVPEPTSFKD